MEVLVALSKLEQAVRIREVAVAVWVHVLERTPDEDIAFADVRRRDGEANDPMHAGRYATFDHAAEVGWKILVAHHPVVLRCLAVDDEVWQCARVGNATRCKWRRGARRPDRGRLLGASARDRTKY